MLSELTPICEKNDSNNTFINDIYFENLDNNEIVTISTENTSNIQSASDNSLYPDYDDDDEDESILDTNWMQDFEQYHQISTNKERELANSIGSYFIYINKSLYIEKITFEKCALEIDPENGVSVLPNKTVLKMVQDRKVLTPVSKYKLTDILSYVVNIEPEKVQQFSQTSPDKLIDQNSDDNEDFDQGFLKVLPIVNDIHIDKSIFIFHNVNHLYFIFQEIEISHHHRTTLKSILKGSNKTFKDRIVEENIDHNNNNNNNTKKVRIITEPRELVKSHKKHRCTKKNYTITS